VDYSDTRLVVQAILPEQRMAMNVGDEVFGGLTVQNSEVGFSSVIVSQYLHRLACTNGMIVQISGKSFRRIHLKRRESLAEEVREAFSKVIEGIPRSLSQMKESREVALPDPESSLSSLPRRFGLSEIEHDAATSDVV